VHHVLRSRKVSLLEDMATTIPAQVVSKQRTVLITGCSDGGLGAALAIALHRAGLRVYATARNASKLTEVQSHGIETLTLDVLSSNSIAAAVTKVPRLDILVNNAGGLYSMPISDLSLRQAKELFDLNVWSYLEVAQAFLPLLLQSRGVIVNQTSTAGLLPLGFQSVYNASKAAIIMFTDCLRLELAPFGVQVVDLRTSSVTANGFKNQSVKSAGLPKGSLYEQAKEIVESTMDGERFAVEVTAAEWAQKVTKELLRSSPPTKIWAGTKSWVMKLASWRPFALPDWMLRKMVGLDDAARKLSKASS
jgi:1-acylglycerone phosphate reductase